MIENHSRSPSLQENKEERRWSRLAFVGAFYYLVVFAVGSGSAYNQQIVWMGAGLLGLALVPLFLQHLRLTTLPREGVLLGLFLLWSTTGFMVATDRLFLVRYLKLLAELTAIVIAISLILKFSGKVKWFHLAFLIVAVAAIFSIGQPIAMSSLSTFEQIRTEIDAANGLGFGSVLGVLGALALLAETKRVWFRAAIVAGGGVALYGVVLSASRTAFLALIVIAIFWPTVCWASTSRFSLTALLGAVVVLLLAYGAYVFIIQETYMGDRFLRSVNMEDGSTRFRFELIQLGLRIFANNPIFGCGLGDFGVASGTGYFAHNEFVEIAATTGLPGLILYYSVYGVAWRRLSRSLRYVQEPLFRYRINIARMALLILLLTGLVSAPHFLGKPSMFLLATVVGIAHWAERLTQQAYGCVPMGQGTAPAHPRFAAGWPVPVRPVVGRA